jgi:plasmid stabilization system protein ParE
MNPRVVLRADVPDDLHSIVEFLDQWSTTTSDRFLKAVFPAMEELARMPGKGSPKQFHSEKLRDVRSWCVPGFRKYLILYRPMPDGIEVLAVTHGSRKLRALLLRRS